MYITINKYNMKTENFEITINATVEKVWQVLWDELTYMQWTSAFCVGSYAKSDWKKGSSIHFLSPSGRGMYSKIIELEPNKAMVFNHLGEIVDYKEQPNDEKSASWSGSKEAYYLTEIDGKTKLLVTVDMIEEYSDYFKDVFPKALNIVKELSEKNCITITTSIDAPIEKIWTYWNEPKHITQWCTPSEDWHTTKAENNVTVGGKFTSTMAAKDGSFSFDFSGVYTEVKPNEIINYTMDDGRIARILFASIENQIKIVETFEAENQNSIEMQQTGWQSILDNFKKHVED